MAQRPLDAVGEVSVSGAAGEPSRGRRLVRVVAPGSAIGGSGGALGGVVAVGAGFALDCRLGGVALALRPTVGVGAARAGVISIGVAVLLLSRSHPALRIVADDVVPGRRDVVGGDVGPGRRVSRIGSTSCVEVA